MKLVAQGVISAPEPGTARAVAKQCHLVGYPDGEILVTYRLGASSDSEQGNGEIRRSTDGARTFSPPVQIAHKGPHVPKNPVAIAKKVAKESDQTVNNPTAIPSWPAAAQQAGPVPSCRHLDWPLQRPR